MKEFSCSPKLSTLASLFEAYKYQGDVNHITGAVHHLALVLDKSKTIITIHDIRNYEKEYNGLKKKLYGLLWFTLPCKKAKIITTISKFSKQKLVDTFSISPSKIKVIYNPAPLDFEYSENEFNEDKPVILQIGSAPHKNLSRLIKAINEKDFRLLLIRNEDQDIKERLERKNIEYEWYSNISREKVYECYIKSDFVFFASEYEGFGLPILEANAVGRPVVTSNIGPMPEVAGDSALLVDPFSVNEIRNALLKFKNDDELRKDLIKKGLENLSRFKSSKIANDYLAVYQQVAKNQTKN
ncbi:MAG: glycosyltransferase family 1 protein [Balneolaceae bacterium]|nr:glycosyltransferase family 1 protein [Balneolaceae bacterium]